MNAKITTMIQEGKSSQAYLTDGAAIHQLDLIAAALFTISLIRFHQYLD